MKTWKEEPKEGGNTISEEQYRQVLDTVYKQNREVLRNFSLIAVSLFVIMFAISFLVGAEQGNRTFYLVMALVELGFFLAYRFLREDQKNLTTFLNYFFFLVIYVFSAVITLHNPTSKAVTFHVFLILMPEMLVDRPWKIITFMSLVSAAFAFATYKVKPPDMAYADICNVVWVLFLSIVLTAQHVKLRITSLAVRQQIEAERDRDSLTGFFTKKASKREIQQSMLSHSCGAFIFLDIDNFKQINDTYGHDFGDEVLRKLADYIYSYNHTDEVCGRFGGDEFLVFIPDYGSKEAVFQRVHFLLNNLKNNLDYPELDVHPKLSAGIAFYPDDGCDYDDLLHHADSAMYYSKHHGKARVTAYSEAKTKMKNIDEV